MPRPRVHSDATILEAARLEFATNGYNGAGMEQIAANAGTTKPTLYARFGGKPELYERTIRERAQKLLEHLFTTYDDASALAVVAMIDTATRAYFEFFAAYPEDFELLFNPDRSGPAIELAEEVVDGIIGGITGLVERVLARRGQTAPQAARLIATMMVGVAHHTLRQVSYDRRVDREHAVRLATSFTYAAVRGVDPTLIDR